MTLLNNLKVQERQNRVCTTVAIAIVAETCSPFTVLPALMNEYKVSLQDTHVQLRRTFLAHCEHGQPSSVGQSLEVWSLEGVRVLTVLDAA